MVILISQINLQYSPNNLNLFLLTQTRIEDLILVTIVLQQDLVKNYEERIARE